MNDEATIELVTQDSMQHNIQPEIPSVTSVHIEQPKTDPISAPLASPVFTGGDDNEKVLAMSTWSDLVGQIRAINSFGTLCDENKLKIISSLICELTMLETKLVASKQPTHAAIAPYQSQPVVGGPGAITDPSAGITMQTMPDISQAYEQIQAMQRRAGIQPSQILTESKKVYITLGAWEKERASLWPDAVKSTAFSTSIRYFVEDAFVAGFDPRLKNGFIIQPKKV